VRFQWVVTASGDVLCPAMHSRALKVFVIRDISAAPPATTGIKRPLTKTSSTKTPPATAGFSFEVVRQLPD
jgi:hypothetical protein